MMGMIIILATTFLFGLAVGSFLNVVIYRALHGESPFEGRSKCPKCKKKIRAVDNIPLVSFLLLGGKCRWCKTSISWSYPVVEFLTGTLFVWWFVAGSLFFRLTQPPFGYLQPVFWLVVGLLLIVVFFTDLLYGIIPDVAVWILGFSALLYRFFLTSSGIMQQMDFWRSVVSGIGVAAFFLSLILLTGGRGMGMGDAKLGLALGLILGWPRILVAVFLSFFLGALVAVGLLFAGRKKFGQTIPFGPFLVVGTVIALVWGEQLWSSYFALLF
jgi:leader peptidase (prepilin peptidase)/N-methyltransferase